MRYSQGLALSFLFIVAAGGASQAQPSFDCSRNLNRTERTICSVDRLAAMDREVATMIRDLAANPRSRLGIALRVWHKDWLGRRDACGDNVRCIGRRYQERIAELRIVAAAPVQTTRGDRSPQVRVLADGTLEIRRQGASPSRWRPREAGRQPTTDRRRMHARNRSASGVGRRERNWATEFAPILLAIIRNILPADSMQNYLRVEQDAGHSGNELVEYRLRWLAQLTGAGS